MSNRFWPFWSLFSTKMTMWQSNFGNKIPSLKQMTYLAGILVHSSPKLANQTTNCLQMFRLIYIDGMHRLIVIKIINHMIIIINYMIIINN